MSVSRRRLILTASVLLLALGLLSTRRGDDARGAHRQTFGGVSLPKEATAWVTLEGALSVFGATRLREAWALLDGRGRRVHILSPGGLLLRSVGREGDGPGELRHPREIVATGDTLWVIELDGSRIDGLTVRGDFVDRLEPSLPCGAPFVDDAVAMSTEIILAVRCFGLLGDERHILRVQVGNGTTRTEQWPLDRGEGISGDLTRLLVTDDGVLVGSMFRKCLRPLDGASGKSLCLAEEDRVPLRAELRDSLQRSYDTRVPFLGRRVSPYHPYYLDAAVAPPGAVFLQPEGENQTVLRQAGADGHEALRLPPGTLAFLVDSGLLLVEEVMGGVRVALAPLPGGGP